MVEVFVEDWFAAGDRRGTSVAIEVGVVDGRFVSRVLRRLVTVCSC